MIDWYIEISESAPDKLKNDDYLAEVIKTAKPCMDYFCKRLTEIEDFTLEDMGKIFSEIIEELPIMRANIYDGEFVIKYNRWVEVKLTDTTKQIYREIKLEKIFN
jgi:inhibitor of KinA sporulation pathway (predicted exonuclease)